MLDLTKDLIEDSKEIDVKVAAYSINTNYVRLDTVLEEGVLNNAVSINNMDELTSELFTDFYYFIDKNYDKFVIYANGSKYIVKHIED